MQFEDMGQSWTAVRDAVSAGTLRACDPGLADLVGRFDQLLHFACLHLGRKLGVEVQLALSREEWQDPKARADALADSLVNRGIMVGNLRIPNAVAPVTVTADLRAGQVTTSLELDAPRT
jgi:hypothetical protein